MESPMNIYEITSENDNSSDPEFEDYFELNENFTHLTNLIRLQYFTYIKQIIHKNYTEWRKHQTDNKIRIISDEYLEKCAAYYEQRAVRYCMVVQLYRKYMLRIISEIRRETACCELISKLKQSLSNVKPEKDEEELHIHIKHEQINGSQEKLPNKNLQATIAPSQGRSCKDETKNIFPIVTIITERNCDNNNESSQSKCNGDTTADYFHNKTAEECTPLANNSSLVPYGSDDNTSQDSPPCKSPNGLQRNNNKDNCSKEPLDTPYESLSLQEKIQRFQETLNKKQPVENPNRSNLKRKKSIQAHQKYIVHRKLSVSQPISPVSTSSEDELAQDSDHDPIAKDLEMLFGEDKNSNDIEDIFGDSTYNADIALVLREIELSNVTGSEKSTSKTRTCLSTKPAAKLEKKNKRYRLKPLVCDLRQSLWPCELHMWKQRLRETLSQLADANIRHHDQLRERFLLLFGEDSEDEFAPYSPSLELDQVLISSCMKRVAPIIVKYLMHPMNEGLIANRYLFKRLAKKLAFNIVMCDQYADEELIKEQIDMFFCTGRRVENLSDIESI